MKFDKKVETTSPACGLLFIIKKRTKAYIWYDKRTFDGIKGRYLHSNYFNISNILNICFQEEL